MGKYFDDLRDAAKAVDRKRQRTCKYTGAQVILFSYNFIFKNKFEIHDIKKAEFSSDFVFNYKLGFSCYLLFLVKHLSQSIPYTLAEYH